MIERSPESLSSAPPLSACGRSTALAAMHSCHPGERTLSRAGAAASALLDFDIATHADLAAANGATCASAKNRRLRLSPCQTGDVGSDFKHTGVHKFLFK